MCQLRYLFYCCHITTPFFRIIFQYFFVCNRISKTLVNFYFDFTKLILKIQLFLKTRKNCPCSDKFSSEQEQSLLLLFFNTPVKILPLPRYRSNKLICCILSDFIFLSVILSISSTFPHNSGEFTSHFFTLLRTAFSLKFA